MSEFIPKFYKKKLNRVLLTLTIMLALLLPFTSSVAHAQGRTHTVARGETLANIAVAYGVNSTELARTNNVSNANILYVGQQLTIPGGSASAAPAPAVVNPVAATTAVETTASTASVAESIYVVKYGDTLANIAAAYGVSGSSLISANGLPNSNFIWTGQRLRIPGGSAPAATSSTASVVQAAPVGASPAAYGRKLIEVNLSQQTLTAWQGDTQVLHTSISSGTYRTPTVTGRFLVSWKVANQHMYGDDFDLPNVPSVMYFYEGYAIHGAYWHNNFGMPMSHGCVNMVPSQADFLYDWAPVGTEVYVHY